MRRSELAEAVRLFPIRVEPWIRFVANRRRYRFVGEAELRARRRSDTVFVFGSGSSLSDLSPGEWAEISRHDTFGFNWFVHERFVRCDFHLIRGIPDTDLEPNIWRPQLEEYFQLIHTNPFFVQTAFLVHGGFRAINGNRAIGGRLLPSENRVFLWRTNVRDELPSRSFDDGLVHGYSTLQECINAAYLLGWKRIVLAGVDLYDRRYFWLEPEETRSVDLRRGAVAGESHARAASGMVETLGEWCRWLETRDVQLLVLNPRSLLAKSVPVHPGLQRTPDE